MCKIKVTLDIHAYRDDVLYDETFDDVPFYGINGAEVVVPLKRKRNYVFDLYYDRATTLQDVIATVEEVIYGSLKQDVPAVIKYSFLVGRERFLIANKNTKFVDVLEKYLDPNKTGIITVNVLLSCNAGVIDDDGKLRYYVHSKESGKHNEPHIHVRDVGHNYDASVLIEDGEIIAGKLPRKLAKIAKKRILEKQEFFYECWNTLTDGLAVDINRHLKLIDY